MNGQVHWLPVAVVLVALTMIMLLAWFNERSWALFRTKVVHADCPGSQTPVDMIVRQNVDSGEYVDVERCTSSVLRDPDCVDCDKRCLHDLNRKPV